MLIALQFFHILYVFSFSYHYVINQRDCFRHVIATDIDNVAINAIVRTVYIHQDLTVIRDKNTFKSGLTTLETKSILHDLNAPCKGS